MRIVGEIVLDGLSVDHEGVGDFGVPSILPQHTGNQLEVIDVEEITQLHDLFSLLCTQIYVHYSTTDIQPLSFYLPKRLCF